MLSSSASASASAPSRSSSASVPRISTNATATCRCSGSACSLRSSRVYAEGRSWERSTPAGSKNGGTISATSGACASRTAPSRAAPSSRGSNRRAVASLRAISPARATPSVSTHAVASAPVRISSRWIPPTRKAWNTPLCTPIDTRRRTGSGRRGAPPHGRQGVVHPDCRRRRALRVIVAAEEQEYRVAAEFQQIRLVRVGAADQLGERRIDHARDLLGALAPALRERLGEVGEAGDVGEDQRPLEALRANRRRVAQPVDRDPRHERPQRIGRRLEAPCSRLAHRGDSVLRLGSRISCRRGKPASSAHGRGQGVLGRIVIRRRARLTAPRACSSRSTRLTVSRVVPTSPASSSWLSGSVIGSPSSPPVDARQVAEARADSQVHGGVERLHQAIARRQ